MTRDGCSVVFRQASMSLTATPKGSEWTEKPSVVGTAETRPRNVAVNFIIAF